MLTSFDAYRSLLDVLTVDRQRPQTSTESIPPLGDAHFELVPFDFLHGSATHSPLFRRSSSNMPRTNRAHASQMDSKSSKREVQLHL
jgi:hypothetical protein